MNKPPLVKPKSLDAVSGLYVKCSYCDRLVSDTCHETGRGIGTCEHGEDHKYKKQTHVPGTRNKVKAKVFDSRDPAEVFRLSMEFDEEVKKGATASEKEKAKPVLFIELLAIFYSFMCNENVPAHLRIDRSKDELSTIRRALAFIPTSLRKHKHDPATFKISDMNEKIVGEIYEDLEARSFSARNFNKYFSFYRRAVDHYSETYQPIRNEFKRVPRKTETYNPQEFPQHYFQPLLERITYENGIEHYEKGSHKIRYFYQPFLKDSIRFLAETGLRRESACMAKWCDIESRDGIEFLKVPDLKVNRIKKLEGKNERFIYVPISDGLQTVLNDLGYSENRNSDNFIIAPEILKNREKFLPETLSRGFNHFFKQIDPESDLTMKSLRKSYITRMQIYLGQGSHIREITGHAGNEVIQAHYTDKASIAASVRSFSVFPEQTKREEELKQVREQNKEHKLNKGISI